MAQAPPSEPSGRRDRPWYTWLAVGTFVLGFLAGVVTLGLVSESPPAVSAAAADPEAEPREPSTPAGATAEIRVNEACLRAINAARDIATAVEDLGTAAAALDAAQLDEAIRRLQPLQDRLEANSATCETTGTASEEEAGATSSSPATPTG